MPPHMSQRRSRTSTSFSCRREAFPSGVEHQDQVGQLYHGHAVRLVARRDDGRLDEPYMSPQGWEARLHAAGFQGIEALHFDQEFNSNIIATPVRSPVREKRVTLLCMDSASSSVGHIQRVLADKGGILSDIVQFGGDMNFAAGQDIVAMLDIEHPFVHDMTEAQYELLKKLIDDFGKGGSCG